MVIVRFAFFGNPALNDAASLTTVTFKDYALGSFIGFIPGIFILSYVCGALVHAASMMDLLTHPALVSLLLLRVGGIALFVILAKRHSKKQLPNIEML